jgi:hypothetical protein
MIHPVVMITNGAENEPAPIHRYAWNGLQQE